MLGGAGVPSLQRQQQSKGQGPLGAGPGSSEAREVSESTKPSSPWLSKKEGLLARRMKEEVLSFQEINPSPPVPHQKVPCGSPRARCPCCPRGPRALEGTGPREGGNGEDSAEAGQGSTGYRASSVGEFKESDDWSPLLLLLR